MSVGGSDYRQTMQPGIELYESATGEVTLEVRADTQTVWLSLDQMAALFVRDKSTVSRHIAGIFRDGELERTSVVADFATTAADGKSYRVTHFALDVIISVGYRVKSPQGVHFRRWATDVLRRYLIEGAALNQRRLDQIGRLVQILALASDELVSGVAEVLTGYLPGLVLLRDYDAGQVDVKPLVAPGWTLTLDQTRDVIALVGAEFPADTLFGGERGDALQGVLGTVYQGFAGQELYPTAEEKAANLLYLVVKDHPLTDGNKRSGAALFVTFLARNGMLYDAQGQPRIANNTLAAITLMVAMSDPKEKDLMIALLVRMLTDDAP